MTMAKQAWETIVAFKLVWVRVVIYVVLPTFATFLALTKDIDDTKWDSMGRFQRAKLYIECACPGMLALAAFIDQSLARAKAEQEKRNGNHRHATVETGP